MSQMLLSEPVVFPDQFRETCESFLRAWWDDRRREMEQEFGVMDLPLDVDLHRLMVAADVLLPIAQAAAGEVERLDRGEVYESLQTLCERLFAAPGIGASYSIPQEFWDSPIGQMTSRAFVWVNGEDLITLTEAAEIAGLDVKTLSNRIARGTLKSYQDANEPNPRRRTRVSRADIEALKK